MTDQEEQQLKAELEALRGFKQANYLSTKITQEQIDHSKYATKNEFLQHMDSSGIPLFGNAGNQLVEDFYNARPELFPQRNTSIS